MRLQHTLTLLLVSAAITAAGQTVATKPPARPAVVARPADAAEALWVRFVAVPDGAPVRDLGGGHAALDLGRVSGLAGSFDHGVIIRRGPRDFTIVTTFGLQAGRQFSPATARLVGMVTQVSAVHRIVVDGVRLTLSPQVLQTGLQFGRVSRHRLEISVPLETPAMAAELMNAIMFQVVAD